MHAPRDYKRDALELVATLQRLATSPAGKQTLQSLERALPSAAAEIRAAMENPGEALGQLLSTLTRPAVEELAEADRTIASGLARALGRGLARGAKKSG